MRLAILSLAGLLLLPLFTLTVPAQAPAGFENISSKPPRTPEEELKSFHLPPGFEIELVAAEPDIRKPINMNFDDRGRLWVTESVEYPFPVPSDRKGKDCIKILEWTNGGPRADKVTTFTDGLNIPIGILPVTKGAIGYSIPNIWQFSDPDGSDHASKQEVLMASIGFRDTHGMTGSFTTGFDGWVYAVHGFSNTSTLKAKDASSITMSSGNTYRFKPDGSHIEQFTWGQVNPFGLSFDPLGNLYSADCHTRPAMMLLRGGYYDSFGKPHDGLGYAPELMKHDHGSTAIAGIVYYAADHFPAEWRDTLFIGNVVTNRINHDKMQRHGSTYRAIETPDFLKSDDPWFRPVDIKLGPDGALYVADFYNRIIGHYEVPLNHPGRDRERGRIWRIVYRGEDGEAKPPLLPRADWSKATVDELIEDIGHPNLVVRMKATNQLVERGKGAVAPLREVMKPESKEFQRMHALWALERLGALEDRMLKAAAHDQKRGVRVHAMRILSERKEWTTDLHTLARAALSDADPFVQRTAADALGQHPATENVRPLLDRRANIPAEDSHLLHTVRMALRNQLRDAASWKQFPENLTEADRRAIADVAPGIHTPEAAAYLIEHIKHLPEPPATLVRYVGHAARFAAADLQPALLAYVQKDRPDDLRQQEALFRAIQQGTQARGAQLSPEARQWATQLTGKLLASPDNQLAARGIELAGSLKLVSVQEKLTALATQRKEDETKRRAAAAALVAIDARGNIALLARLLTDANELAGLREHAANLLAGINQPESRMELIKALPQATARLQSAIAAGLAGSTAGAEQLLDAVTAGKASARLLLEKPVEIRLQQSKVPDLKKRLAKLTEGLPAVDEKLVAVMKQRRDGFAKAKADVAAGAKVFEKSCAVCHQLGGKGAKVGPQLDGIGIRGLDRLLEDIIDPNRNVDQAFRATTLSLKNGQIVTGLVLREEGEVIVVADQQGKEVRVEKKAVEEKVVSQLSPMPANLVEQIPEADFYHLLAYLLSQRPTKD